MKRFWDRILFYISAPKCVGCKERLSFGDAALCPTCLERYKITKDDRCSACTRLLSECSCTTTYLKSHFVPRVIKVFRYRNTDINFAASSLIYSLKRDNRLDVLDLLATDLSVAIRNSVKEPSELLITNVPRRSASIVKYGFDHAQLLAKALAKKLGAEYKQILVSRSKRTQKKLNFEERLENIDIDIKNKADLSGRKVMLVDDITTSGASLGGSAAILRTLGAKNITAATVAIAYRDENLYRNK